MFNVPSTDEEFRALVYRGRVDFLGLTIDATYVIRFDRENNVMVGKFYGYDAAGEMTDSFIHVPFELRSMHFVAVADDDEMQDQAYATLEMVCKSVAHDNYNVTESSPILCGCEHENHMVGHSNIPKPGYHSFREVKAGSRKAMFVGEVCDACANDCMKNYMIEDLNKFSV